MPLCKAFLSGFLTGVWMCVVLSTAAQPRQVNFSLFTDEDGLPDNSTRIILQDRDGFLWMGRQNGLTKYDGYNFTNFRHSPTDTTTISGNLIMNLFEDRQGRLWVVPYLNGVDISDVHKSAFRAVQLQPDSMANVEVNVEEIVQDHQDRFWFTTNEGLIVLEEKDNQFSRVELPSLLADTSACNFPGRVGELAITKDGIILIGSPEGMFAYHPDSKSLSCPELFKGLPAVSISDIKFDRLDRTWVSTLSRHDRLYYADEDGTTFRAFDEIPFDTLFRGASITFDHDNRMWLSVFSDKGYGYDFRDSSLFFLSTQNPEITHERFFREPMVDHSGKVWIPVDGFLTADYPKGFNSYRHPYPFHQATTAVNITDKAIWLGIREHGLIKIDRVTGATEHYTSNQTGKYHIPGSLIGDITALRSGAMLVVAFDYIFIIDTDGKVSATLAVGGSNRSGFQDSKGRIWIGTVGTWSLFDEKQGFIKHYRLPAILGDNRNFIQDFEEDKDGNLWIASGGKGLVRFNPETAEIKHFHYTKNAIRPLPTNNVLDIAIDKNNIVWVGTDIGLLRLDPLTLQDTFYDAKTGLINDHILAVTSTADGMIWMATNAGLSSFNPVTHDVHNYAQRDGLLNSGFYDRAIHLAANGQLYAGGKNGLDYFHPGQLRANITAPKMRLTNVSLIREGKAQTFPHQTSSLTLSHKDDLIAIEFSGMHYSDQHEVRYAYKLEPLHNDWIDLGNEHKVLFSNLKPGHYTFRARAITPDGIASTEDLALPIEVTPPFFQTIWFRFLAFCLILAFVVGYIRYRERVVQQKEHEEAEVSRKLMELEKRALQAQMNPHFIYNSMNSIQQFILMHDTEGAMKYLTRFSRILRTVLNMSSQSRIPLYEEIKLIEDYIELESMRFPNKFTYEIDVSPELNIHSVEIPPFFIQPQVENAIRHGLLRKSTPGHLRIGLNKEEENLLITVQDNGIGREASREGKFNEVNKHESKGLGIIEERLKYLRTSNGHHPFRIIDLYDAQHQATGTRVEIVLPID